MTTMKMTDRGPDRALLKCLQDNLPAILNDRPVMLAYLYGSAAEGYQTPLSDLDIALVVDPDAGMDAYRQFKLAVQIGVEIEAYCQVREADVRFVNDAPLAVQGKVLTQGVLLYSREEDFRVEYEVLTRKRYFDFQPVLAMMRDAYFSRLEAELAAGESHG